MDSVAKQFESIIDAIRYANERYDFYRNQKFVDGVMCDYWEDQILILEFYRDGIIPLRWVE